MNSTVPEGPKVGSIGYCIGVSAGITLLVATISLVSYYCTRGRLQRQQPSEGTRGDHDPIAWILNVRSSLPPDGNHIVLVVETGLDENTIAGFPKLLYSEVKRKGTEGSTVPSCCSICLADYKGNDDLRILPECGHVFHHKCVDPWLRLHPTCPVCRTSPVPAPE